MLKCGLCSVAVIIDGITLTGSATVKGIAPSIMKDIHSAHAALPASFSAGLNLFLCYYSC